MVEPLLVSNETITISQEVLFARPNNKTSRWSFSSIKFCENSLEKESDLRQTLLLITEESDSIRLKGEWVIEILSIPAVTTLLSFLDFHTQYRRDKEDNYLDKRDNKRLISSERSFTLIADENKTFRGTMIAAILNPQHSKLEKVFDFLRCREDYWVCYFLLSQVMNKEENEIQKIQSASKRYGVSESYFRKLCYRALTRSPKKQLRLWRAAHSVLQLIEQEHSISTIAGSNGFASSSHFASEIKSHFGITPREFRKMGKYF